MKCKCGCINTNHYYMSNGDSGPELKVCNQCSDKAGLRVVCK